MRRASVARRQASSREIIELTAAAVRVRKPRAGQYRRLIQPWQSRALSYYDLVGECWNSAQFYSRSLRQIRLFVAERDDNGELKETENETVKNELARIQDPGGGGYSRLLDAYGRLMFLCGEGYFLVTNPDLDEESWEFVSSDELRIDGDGTYTRFAAPSLPAQLLRDPPDTSYKPVGDEALVMRAWRPHPRYSALADSPVRAVLELLEELVLLTLAVRARAKSRLAANGILYLPDGLSQATMEAVGDEDPMLDPFMEDLIEQVVSPIESPGTAAAVLPALIRGPDDLGEKIKFIQISNPLETYPEQGLRTEAVKRYAIGIEMPSRLLTGEAANHWGDWLLEEQAAKQYIFPMCQQLCDDLTSVYLRPTLKDDNVPDWDRYVIGYDASAVVAHPDRAKDARELHDRLVISDEALRNATAFNDSDAPDDDELNRRIGVKLKDVGLATGEPYDPGKTPAINADEEQTGEEGAPQAGGEVDAGAPEDIPTDGEMTVRGAAFAVERESVISRMLGGCAIAIIRGRELAGSRLRTKMQHMPATEFSTSLTPHETLAQERIPSAELARALGIEWVRTHAGSERSLVSGCTAGLREMLLAWGLDEKGADGLCELVITHAARTLYGGTPADQGKAIRSYVEALTPA